MQTLYWANHEAVPSCFYDRIRHKMQVVHAENALDLSEEAPQEPEITSRHSNQAGDHFREHCSSGSVTPAGAHLLSSKVWMCSVSSGPELINKTDARVELRKASPGPSIGICLHYTMTPWSDTRPPCGRGLRKPRVFCIHPRMCSIPSTGYSQSSASHKNHLPVPLSWTLLQREINEGLNVIENWNSVNNFFIFFGKGGVMAANRRRPQDWNALALPPAARTSLRQYHYDPTGSGLTCLGQPGSYELLGHCPFSSVTSVQSSNQAAPDHQIRSVARRAISKYIFTRRRTTTTCNHRKISASIRGSYCLPKVRVTF
jgi:Tn3 transposase DDE domain